MRLPRARVDELKSLGLGVTLLSAEGNLVFRWEAGSGVFARGALGRGTEVSDMGGEGGSCISEAVRGVDTGLESGGVVISGELAVEIGEFEYMGECGIERSVEIAER